MKTSGKTMVYGVMGCPVEHSVSPVMHNLFSEHSGIDMTYVPFPVEPGQVEAAVKGAFALGIRGINVTVPHKQAVVPWLEAVDETARMIGAVNTLVRTETGYKGYNTDAAGLYRAMREAGMDPRGRTCILLGAGGAAKAAACVLIQAEAKKGYLLNRSVDKALRLAEEMNRLAGRDLFTALALTDWEMIPETCCLAVQTTSVGMHPHVEDSPVEDEGFFRKLELAFDVVYTPVETRFMKLAKAAGARTSNGLDMLLYQGVAAYELWNPHAVISDAVIRQARALILDHLGGKM